jgi:hypothetical protein
LHRLEDPRFFTSLDLLKGFWQIPIAPEDRNFFAFSTETMHLEYNVAPMGAKKSPACLSALIQLVLRGLTPQNVIAYLDDVLLADTTVRENLHTIDRVLTAFVRAGLKLNPAKCNFAQKKVICLGHRLSREGIGPDPTNVSKIKNWPVPKKAAEVKSFLGLSGYYRQYIKNYSEIEIVFNFII